MISSIFQTLQYFITERVPDIQYISLYNNQFNNPDSNTAFKTPAVLIEILPIDFQDLLNNIQYSEVKVNIHLATDIYNSFDKGDIMQDNSLDHLKMLDKLYIGLNNVNSQKLPDEMKSDVFIQSIFKRTGVRLQQNNSVLNQSIISGSFIMFDYSAMKLYNEYELTDITLREWYYPDPPFSGETQARVVEIN